jgi:hypothetical protein
MTPPEIFNQIWADPLAAAGVVTTLCAMLVFAVPEFIRQTDDFREVHEYYDRLQGRQVQTSFRGELLIVAGKSTNAALVALFWTCHTIKHIKDHVFESATDVFSVWIMVQLCVIIASAGHAGDMWEALGHAATQVPWVELAALAAFNYVVWRVGSYWKVARRNFQNAILQS